MDAYDGVESRERSEVDESFRGLWYFGTVCSFSVPTSLRFTFARSICPPPPLPLLLPRLFFFFYFFETLTKGRSETEKRHQQRENRRERSSFWLAMSTVGHNLQVDPGAGGASSVSAAVKSKFEIETNRTKQLFEILEAFN